MHASFGVGAMVEAVRERLWIGASYQAQPALGPMKLDGTLSASLGADVAPPRPVTYTYALPDIVRAGLRARPMSGRRALELRVYGDITRWSRLQTQCVSVQGEPCAVFPDGTDATPGATTIQNIRRRWKDTYGAHLGASFWMSDAVEVFAGVGFATAAAPDATLDPMMPDATSHPVRGRRSLRDPGRVLRHGRVDRRALCLARQHRAERAVGRAAPHAPPRWGRQIPAVARPVPAQSGEAAFELPVHRLLNPPGCRRRTRARVPRHVDRARRRDTDRLPVAHREIRLPIPPHRHGMNTVRRRRALLRLGAEENDARPSVVVRVKQPHRPGHDDPGRLARYCGVSPKVGDALPASRPKVTRKPSRPTPKTPPSSGIS